MPTSTHAAILTDKQDLLDQACADIATEPLLGMDTEFVRTSTYAPQLCLLQLSSGNATWCIDLLADLDFTQLWSLVMDPQRLKILHALKQDLEAIWYVRNELPASLADTQIAAGLLGHPPQSGYAALLEKMLGVKLGKEETRTDWSRRPLSDAQIRYAGDDAVYLPAMHQQLQDELQTAGRADWAREDCAALNDISLYAPQPIDAWRRIKSAPYLPPAQQARLRALCAWREDRAVHINKPRQWILGDEALLQLAELNPATVAEISRCPEVPATTQRKSGDRLIEALSAANRDFAEGKLEIRQENRRDDNENAAIKRLGAIVKETADNLGIAAEILASRKDLVALVRAEPDPRPLRGWRRDIVGTRLETAL